MDPTAKARGVLDDAYRELGRPDELAEITARAMVDEAQARAGGRPTPQARMVAAGLSVSRQTIQGPSGTLAALLYGSDYGSTIYRQFHNRFSGGSWLTPVLDEPPPSVTDLQEDWLDDLLR